MSDVRDPGTDQALPAVNNRPFVQDMVIADIDARKVLGRRMVIADIDARKVLGRRKYGTLLQSGNGRNMLRDAYEEALDLVIYLRGALDEEEHSAG